MVVIYNIQAWRCFSRGIKIKKNLAEYRDYSSFPNHVEQLCGAIYEYNQPHGPPSAWAAYEVGGILNTTPGLYNGFSASD